jgi:hypothetical protein
MTQFLRVRADHCQLVIDSRYVQEVDSWHDTNPPARETLWHDVLLQGVSLADILDLPDKQVAAMVVLRNPDNGIPAVLLGVSEIVGLIDLPMNSFHAVLDMQINQSITPTAIFSTALETVLLRLEVGALLTAKQEPASTAPDIVQ